MTRFREETALCIEAVRDALSRARQGPGEVHVKVGRDVVTDADLAVEDHLRRQLARAGSWPVIGEERGGEVPADGPYWLVDPVCGTRNFASGVPLYSVNVALVEGGRVAVGVVGDGSSGDVLAAEMDRGAWRVHETGLVALATSASSRVVDVGAWPKAISTRERAARQLAGALCADRWDTRCLSTTLALGLVATGQIAGCVLFSTPDAVHVAAGALLVAEAGGRVTDASGEPWGPASRSLICAADSHLHAELLEAFGAIAADVVPDKSR